MAKTVREIRARDPNFDMVKFLRSLREDVRPVITVGGPHLHSQDSTLYYCSMLAIWICLWLLTASTYAFSALLQAGFCAGYHWR